MTMVYHEYAVQWQWCIMSMLYSDNGGSCVCCTVTMLYNEYAVHNMARDTKNTISVCDKQQEHLVDLETHRVNICLVSCWKWGGVTRAQSFALAGLRPSRGRLSRGRHRTAHTTWC
jgi:hypothetical protein